MGVARRRPPFRGARIFDLRCDGVECEAGLRLRVKGDSIISQALSLVKSVIITDLEINFAPSRRNVKDYYMIIFPNSYFSDLGHATVTDATRTRLAELKSRWPPR